MQNKELITIEAKRLCEEGQVLLCCDNSKFQIWNNLQHISNCMHRQIFALFFSLGAPVEQLSVTKSPKKNKKKTVQRN